MRPLPSTRLGAPSILLAMALLTSPAIADEVADHHGPGAGSQHHAPQPPMMSLEARDAWLAECRNRLSNRGWRGNPDDVARATQQCEDYLDTYYAYYRGYQSYGQGYGYPHGGYAAPCCQPMPMAPWARMPRAEPVCTETVEYEYVDVPAPAHPPRVREKRIKVAPDKRMKVQ